MPAAIGREQRHIRQTGGRLRHPHLGLPRPRCWPSASTRAAQLEELRRALRVPAELVLARPLHAHRPADGLREQRGVGRGVVVRRSCRSSRSRRGRSRAPCRAAGRAARANVSRKRCVRLRRGPDRAAVGAHVGDRARRADRAVRSASARSRSRASVCGAVGRRVERGRRRPWRRSSRRATNGPSRTQSTSAGVAGQRRALRSTAPSERARGAHGGPLVVARRRRGNPRCAPRARRECARPTIRRPRSSVAPTAGGRITRPCSMPGSDKVVHVDVAAGELGRHVGPRQRLADERVARRVA